MGLRGICLDTVNSAGGVLKSTQQDFVRVGGRNVIVVGDTVLPHPTGLPHTIPNVMVTGVPWIRINGIPVCFKGDKSSCGHVANGTDWVYVNG